MAESVVISNIKENILEFDAEVKGIKDPKMSVCFVIKTDMVDLSFAAKHERGNTWSVVIPPIKMLEIGDVHPYLITVVVEGYHFEPMSGRVEVIGEVKAKASRPVVAKQEKKVETKPEEKKAEPVKEEKPKVEIKPQEKKAEAKVEQKEEKDPVKETREQANPLEQTIDRIITRETLRKSPTDVAVRRVLDEVKKPAEPVVPQETPEQAAARIAEETRLAEQAAREAAVRNILNGMSGTRATIRH